MIGRQIGVYRIEALLGVGGMAEVYRGRDSRLGRDVAIKILPSLFTADAERLARLEREARVLATLNHPHIGAIHGVEVADGLYALVLELVDGETLAARLERGPLAIREALTCARQIADALEAAHERGVVHRDLKPGNLALTPAGVVKVLDFGLAKTGAVEHPAHAQTATFGTREGLILGTAAYMSPEQARGQPVDRRTDIWAFGCVLYEMLTGRMAFGGNTASDTLARVLEREPDWSALPPGLPAPVTRLLRRCLEKESERRLRDIADARLEIDDAIAGAESQVPAHSLSWIAGAPLVRMIAAGALGATMAGAAVLWLRPATIAPESRLEVTTPSTVDPSSIAISPDGRQLAYVASGDGPSQIWLRSLDSVTARPLPGTEDAANPFWSPDSRSIAFFAGSTRLRRVDVDGGSALTLAAAAPGVGGTWGSDGVILFTITLTGPVYRVLASGGDVVPATRLLPRQSSHTFPRFLPDGRRFLFYAVGPDDVQGIYVGSLDSDAISRVTPADSAGSYLPGWLLFVRQGTLFGQRFDADRAALSGEAIPIANSVEVNQLMPGNAAFSTSLSGVIAYRDSRISPRQLTWFDRSGNALGTLGPVFSDNLLHPQIAPDGRRVAFSRAVDGNIDIWLFDPPRLQRITTDPAEEQYPVWSPDGKRLGFTSARTGVLNVHVKPLDPPGADQVVGITPIRKMINDWSPDARFVTFHQPDPKTGPDLLYQPLDGDRAPAPFLASGFVEVWSEFSPDGRLVAYQSNETGRFEIYVRRFPPTGDQWSISTGGGIYPQWSADGTELFFVDPAGSIMAASIRQAQGTVDAGTPAALFKPRMLGRGTNFVARRRQYDVAPDGRFLVNVEVEETDAAPITVILNWRSLSEGR
jgi:serine/threonine protein kinase